MDVIETALESPNLGEIVLSLFYFKRGVKAIWLSMRLDEKKSSDPENWLGSNAEPEDWELFVRYCQTLCKTTGT